DQQHERVFERVAAVDVAKASGMVCTRTPNPARPGARHSTVWEVPAAMNAVLALADRLVAGGIEMVTLESTADYWRIWYYVLEGAGLAVQLVTASQARNLPGRPKTDRLDAMGLAGLARGRMKAKHDALVEALTGMFDDHHGELAQMLLDQIAFCDTRIAALATRIEQHLAQIPAAWGVDGDRSTGPAAGTGPDAAVLPAAQRLAEIPGVSTELARSIIAETGLDMSRFPTAAHLVSWAGLCPS